MKNLTYAAAIALLIAPVTAQPNVHTETATYGPVDDRLPDYLDPSGEVDSLSVDLYVAPFDACLGALQAVEVQFTAESDCKYEGQLYEVPWIATGVNGNLRVIIEIDPPAVPGLVEDIFFNQTVTVYEPDTYVYIGYPWRSASSSVVTITSGLSSFTGSSPVKLDLDIDFVQEAFASRGSIFGYFESLGLKVTATVNYIYTETFTDLGGGTTGSAGVPVLAGCGSLAPGSSGTLHLAGAASDSLVIVAVAADSDPIPFAGGTLHANPAVVLIPYMSDGSGALTVPFTWPSNATSGFQVTVQAGVLDPVGFMGVALSNGLTAITP